MSRIDEARLGRVLNPKSIAIVGVADDSRFAGAARHTLESDAEVYFVHRRATEAFGRKTFPDLRSIGRSVDMVFSAVPAEGSLAVIEDSVGLDCGGVVAIAAGFAEQGEEGAHLQDRMRRITRDSGMPVVGPNGVGVINVPRGIHTSMLDFFPRREGGLSVIAHSGASIGAIASASWRPGGPGLNLLISAGNEATTDMADYISYLAEDDQTTVIALVVEKIRRPAQFFDAAARCLQNGKAIVAVKLGRHERAQQIAASHTGTITTDSWVYDVAFAQAGIQRASDIDDLVDRVQFLEQLPPERWSPVRGLAFLTATGGFAQLASDLAEEEGVDIPMLPRLDPLIREKVPGAGLANPLDTTDVTGGVPGLWEELLQEYASEPAIDTIIYASQHAEWDTATRSMADRYVSTLGGGAHPLIITPLAGVGGGWLQEYRNAGVAIGNGLRGSFRGLRTMADHVRTPKSSRVSSPDLEPRIPRPAGVPVISSVGPISDFDSAMKLLAEHGIPVAPYLLLGDGEEEPASMGFAGPYVVKIAELPHRTELGAVMVGVEESELGAAVADLRSVADRIGASRTIAVQPMIQGHGELFIGIRSKSELGPVVVVGLGGTLVELNRGFVGRMAPLTADQASELLAEVNAGEVMDGYRGKSAWPKGAIEKVLRAAGRLAAGSTEWLSTLDINPLIVTETGVVAVDALSVLDVSPQSSGATRGVDESVNRL